MGLGELYISLLLLKTMTWQQTQFYSYCAQQSDPVACVDSIPSRSDLEDNLMYADEPTPQYRSGQFYHYQDPTPLPEKTCPAYLRRQCY